MNDEYQEDANPNKLELKGWELKRYREIVSLRLELWGHPAGKIRWVDGVPCRAIDYPEQISDQGLAAQKIEESREKYNRTGRKKNRKKSISGIEEII